MGNKITKSCNATCCTTEDQTATNFNLTFGKYNVEKSKVGATPSKPRQGYPNDIKDPNLKFRFMFPFYKLDIVDFSSKMSQIQPDEFCEEVIAKLKETLTEHEFQETVRKFLQSAV